ncbi:MAG: tRNA epoxyqueuosine(34) reductase QueG [Magnetovibrionaceae bacterium]
MQFTNMDKVRIRARATELGFQACGFAEAFSTPETRQALRQFLKQGHQGGMDWMAETETRRADPKKLWPDARSAIVLALSYAPKQNPQARLGWRDRGVISVYAQGADYHDLVKKRLKTLAREIVEATGEEVKVFVDTAPLMEKPLGSLAGLGWQGKHTNLVSRKLGNWFFIGTILTTLDLPPDRPEPDHCGSCSACQQACPTHALDRAYQIDARACISYLTIEHKGPIPEDMMAAMGNRLYGCDDCLAACPWNKFTEPHKEQKFFPRAESQAPRLADLAGLSEADFRNLFSGSPVKRTGRDRFLRNVAIAVGNSADQTLVPTAERLAEDESALVAEAGRWALRRLGIRDE